MRRALVTKDLPPPTSRPTIPPLGTVPLPPSSNTTTATPHHPAPPTSVSSENGVVETAPSERGSSDSGLDRVRKWADDVARASTEEEEKNGLVPPPPFSSTLNDGVLEVLTPRERVPPATSHAQMWAHCENSIMMGFSHEARRIRRGFLKSFKLTQELDRGPSYFRGIFHATEPCTVYSISLLFDLDKVPGAIDTLLRSMTRLTLQTNENDVSRQAAGPMTLFNFSPSLVVNRAAMTLHGGFRLEKTRDGKVVFPIVWFDTLGEPKLPLSAGSTLTLMASFSSIPKFLLHAEWRVSYHQGHFPYTIMPTLAIPCISLFARNFEFMVNPRSPALAINMPQDAPTCRVLLAVPRSCPLQPRKATLNGKLLLNVERIAESDSAWTVYSVETNHGFSSIIRTPQAELKFYLMLVDESESEQTSADTDTLPPPPPPYLSQNARAALRALGSGGRGGWGDGGGGSSSNNNSSSSAGDMVTIPVQMCFVKEDCIVIADPKKPMRVHPPLLAPSDALLATAPASTSGEQDDDFSCGMKKPASQRGRPSSVRSLPLSPAPQSLRRKRMLLPPGQEEEKKTTKRP